MCSDKARYVLPPREGVGKESSRDPTNLKPLTLRPSGGSARPPKLFLSVVTSPLKREWEVLTPRPYSQSSQAQDPDIKDRVCRPDGTFKDHIKLFLETRESQRRTALAKIHSLRTERKENHIEATLRPHTDSERGRLTRSAET